MKFGRIRPTEEPKMKLVKYKVAALPTPPLSIDYSPKASLSLDNIYRNGILSCCVISGGYHILGTWTGNAGTTFVATDAQIDHDYGAICGYNPKDPSSDQGCDETVALKYWKQKGFVNGDKLFGSVGVDATDELEMKQCVDLFENLMFGMELPDAWVTEEGQNLPVWDVAGDPNPDNGHCVVGYGYGDTGVIIDTWGMRKILTWKAAAKYAVKKANGETYSLLSQAQLVTAAWRAPNGLYWKQLLRDFQSV